MKEHSKEAHLLAEAILKASGSSLKYYSLERIRDDILEMAQAGIDSARAPLISAMREALKEAPNSHDDVMRTVNNILRRAIGE